MNWLSNDCSTPKVGAVGELGHDSALFGDDVQSAGLDEVHLGADAALRDHKIARLVHFELEFGHHRRHEKGVGSFEERHHAHQVATVVVQHLLNTTQHHFFIIIIIVPEMLIEKHKKQMTKEWKAEYLNQKIAWKIAEQEQKCQSWLF